MMYNLPKFSSPILVNTVKLLKTCYQIYQNVSHHFLSKWQLAKILPFQNLPTLQYASLEIPVGIILMFVGVKFCV